MWQRDASAIIVSLLLAVSWVVFILKKHMVDEIT